MKIPINWLHDYLEITKTPREIGDDLSRFGFTVEAINEVGNDTILDLEINPNRGDCLSILGIARELSALYNKKLKKISDEDFKEEKLDKNIALKIFDPDICPRYTARIIDKIEIKQSPKYLQDRLIAYGFRPINNIVDITNYVMVATGQPLHAFDFDKIAGGRINLRISKEGEELITLDGKQRKLPVGTIIIDDGDKIYDLAGIMGGIKSEIDSKTKTIILQSAIFDPKKIRQTSKQLSHTTDASYRYERGVDILGTKSALDLATALIKESCPKAKIGSVIDQCEKYQPKKITLEDKQVNNLLGTSLSSDQIDNLLSRLNIVKKQDSYLIPSYREYDLTIWQDLAEEIARIFGYENIGEIVITNQDKPKINSIWEKRQIIKQVLKNSGLTESYACSLIDEKQIKLFGFEIEKCRQILNPLSCDMEYLRPSLQPSLLETIVKNPWAPEVAIFQIGKVTYDFTENWQVGIALVGNVNKIELDKLNIFSKAVSIDKSILDYYKIRRPVKIILLNFEDINMENIALDQPQPVIKYRSISKYAPTIRDLAFIVDKNITGEEIAKFIKDTEKYILFVEIFDEYQSDKFGQNKKNLAFHIWIDSQEVISETKANDMINNIINLVENKYQAKLRS